MTAELFSTLPELPTPGITVNDVVVMGTTRQGPTAVVGLGMTIDRSGFALRRIPSEEEFILPWTRSLPSGRT